MNVNKVILVGRLTRDPETRTTPNGQNVTSFGLATNRVWTDASGQKQERTDFHNIVVWGKQADNCQQYLIKGQEIYIEGRIETRSWQTPDSIKKYRTDIIARNVQFGAKPRGAAPAAKETPAEETPEEKPSSTEATKGEEEINVEEIPF